MTDVQPSTGGADAGSSAAGVGAVATAPTSNGLKDPRQLAEAVLVKMLCIYEQLANANMLLSVPQVGGLMRAHLEPGIQLEPGLSMDPEVAVGLPVVALA